MATLNARVGAVALIAGSSAATGLGFAPVQLTPLLLLALGVSVFGVWAFADEMGVQKPLNRAGLVAFGFAAFAKTMLLLNNGQAGKSFVLLYLFALLFSLFLWSAALLHRDRSLKVVGAFGAAATVLPILGLIAGHIFLGAGAILGIGALYDFSSSAANVSPTMVSVVDGVFLVWSVLAAALLWTGRIRDT